MKRGFLVAFSLVLGTTAAVLFGQTSQGINFTTTDYELVQFFLQIDNPLILRQAGFTREQITQINNWQKLVRRQYRNLRQAEAKLLKQFRDELTSTNPDARKLESLLDRRYELRQKAEQDSLKWILKVRELLGAEKFVRLVKNLEKIIARQQATGERRNGDNQAGQRLKTANKKAGAEQDRYKDVSGTKAGRQGNKQAADD